MSCFVHELMLKLYTAAHEAFSSTCPATFEPLMLGSKYYNDYIFHTVHSAELKQAETGVTLAVIRKKNYGLITPHSKCSCSCVPMYVVVKEQL